MTDCPHSPITGYCPTCAKASKQAKAQARTKAHDALVSKLRAQIRRRDAKLAEMALKLAKAKEREQAAIDLLSQTKKEGHHG